MEYPKTIKGKMRLNRIKLGWVIRKIGRWIGGSYWVCSQCGVIEFKEKEVWCWNCGIGEMIYQGKLQ